MTITREGLPAWLLSFQRGYQAVEIKLRKNRKMSSRVLRKLQGDKELEISHDDEEDEDELTFTSAKSRKKQKAAVNPFDLVSKYDHVHKPRIYRINVSVHFQSFISHLLCSYA